MKRLVYSLVILSILLFACNISPASTPTLLTVPTVATVPTVITVPTDVTVPTDITVPTVVPVPTVVAVPPIATNVTCNELKFHLDPALASSYDCKTEDAVTEGIEVNPQYTKLTLQGYVLSGKFFEPHISVFLVQSYTRLLPDLVPGFVSSLQALIGGGPTPVFTGSFDSPHLPFLPVFNAGQVFFAGYQVVPFVNGSGTRYLTEFAQYNAPVNNNDLFYTYQGLTSDGKYWVSAILPINNPILLANANNPPSGDYGAYITGMVNQLNSQTSDSYTPTVAALDALVASITIQP